MQCTFYIYTIIIRAVPGALRLIVKEVSLELRRLSSEVYDFCEELLEMLFYRIISQILSDVNSRLSV